MEVLGYNAQLHCTWRQVGRATAGLVASSPSSSAHRYGYGGGHRKRATTGRGRVVGAQGGAAWGVGRRELGLGLGFNGSEEGWVVGWALSEGGDGGGGGGGGRGRFGGGGGGGDDEESDGDAGVPVPQQSFSILAW